MAITSNLGNQQEIMWCKESKKGKIQTQKKKLEEKQLKEEKSKANIISEEQRLMFSGSVEDAEQFLIAQNNNRNKRKKKVFNEKNKPKSLVDLLQEQNEKHSSDSDDSGEDEDNSENVDNDNGGLAKDVKKFDEINPNDDSDEFDEVKKKKSQKKVVKTDNLDTLKLKRVDLEEKKKLLEQKLSKFSGENLKKIDENDDDLDSFMKNNYNSLNNEEKTKLENEYNSLLAEISKTEKLIEFVTPTLDKVSLNKRKDPPKESSSLTIEKTNENIQIEKNNEINEKIDSFFNEDSDKKPSSLPLFTSSSLSSDKKEKKQKKKKRKVKGPSKDVLFSNNQNHGNENNDFDDDNKFSNWVAPKGQSGDGKTKLNEKYGY